MRGVSEGAAVPSSRLLSFLIGSAGANVCAAAECEIRQLQGQLFHELAVPAWLTRSATWALRLLSAV